MPDRLITIASYIDPFEAILVQAELESLMIEVILKDVATISLNWLWSVALGGVKVQVLEPDVAEALRILAAEPAEEPSDPTDGVACPTCGSNLTHFFLDKRGAFLTLLVLGFPVIPAFPRQVCEECGNRWKP